MLEMDDVPKTNFSSPSMYSLCLLSLTSTIRKLVKIDAVEQSSYIYQHKVTPHTGRIYANADYTLNLAETNNNVAGHVAIKTSECKLLIEVPMLDSHGMDMKRI